MKKNEEVLKNIERARKRREEEENKYKSAAATSGGGGPSRAVDYDDYNSFGGSSNRYADRGSTNHQNPRRAPVASRVSEDRSRGSPFHGAFDVVPNGSSPTGGPGPNVEKEARYSSSNMEDGSQAQSTSASAGGSTSSFNNYPQPQPTTPQRFKRYGGELLQSNSAAAAAMHQGRNSQAPEDHEEGGTGPRGRGKDIDYGALFADHSSNGSERGQSSTIHFEGQVRGGSGEGERDDPMLGESRLVSEISEADSYPLAGGREKHQKQLHSIGRRNKVEDQGNEDGREMVGRSKQHPGGRSSHRIDSDKSKESTSQSRAKTNAAGSNTVSGIGAQYQPGSGLSPSNRRITNPTGERESSSYGDGRKADLAKSGPPKSLKSATEKVGYPPMTGGGQEPSLDEMVTSSRSRGNFSDLEDLDPDHTSSSNPSRGGGGGGWFSPRGQPSRRGRGGADAAGVGRGG